MRASTRRVISILFSALLLVATLGIYGNLIRPKMNDIAKKRVEVQAKKAAFNEQKGAVDKVRALVARLRGAEQAREGITLVMPRDPALTSALHQLQAIARSSQTTLTSFDAKPLPFESGASPLIHRLGAFEITMNMDGSYESLKNFLKALETNVRVFNVKNVSIKGRESGRESAAGRKENFFSANITAVLYYQEGSLESKTAEQQGESKMQSQ